MLAASPPPCAQNVRDLQTVGLRLSMPVSPPREKMLLLRLDGTPNFTMSGDPVPLLPPEGAQGARLPSGGGSGSGASGGACSLLLGVQQGGSLNPPSCAPLCLTPLIVGSDSLRRRVYLASQGQRPLARTIKVYRFPLPPLAPVRSKLCRPRLVERTLGRVSVLSLPPPRSLPFPLVPSPLLHRPGLKGGSQGRPSQ